MKNRLIVACIVLCLSATAVFAQNSTQELPSAPSSTVQPKKFPGAPQTPPQQKKPVTPETAPAQPQTSNTQPAADQNAATTQAAPSDQKTAPAFPAVDVAPQQPQQKPTTDEQSNQSVTTIKKTVNEVNVVFTVTDKHGKFVKNLKQDDFRILDNGKPPAAVTSFESETNLPLRVGLLIDASNSIRDRFHFEQDAAIEFLNQIIRRNSDKAFVIGFDSTPMVTQDFTDDTDKLARGVRELRAGGGTALFDAIYYACRDKLANANSATGRTRKAIILLTDGEDNQSRVTREEAIEMAQRAEVTIYAISTNISGIKTRGDKVLERFADTTGGRVFFPFRIQEVSDAFYAIQDELRSQYALSYRPADFAHNGEYHSIRIEPTHDKKLLIRAKKGYYAPTS